MAEEAALRPAVDGFVAEETEFRSIMQYKKCILKLEKYNMYSKKCSEHVSIFFHAYTRNVQCVLKKRKRKRKNQKKTGIKHRKPKKTGEETLKKN